MRKSGAEPVQVLATAKPLLEEGEFHNLRGEVVRYRQCLLPLGEEAERFMQVPVNNYTGHSEGAGITAKKLLPRENQLVSRL